jgi:hypothetical protein
VSVSIVQQMEKLKMVLILFMDLSLYEDEDDEYDDKSYNDINNNNDKFD